MPGSQRLRRVADQIQRELSGLLRTELKDPRVGMITLTGLPPPARQFADDQAWQIGPTDVLKILRLFPDLRWEKEVRWERTAMNEGQGWIKLGDEFDR